MARIYLDPHPNAEEDWGSGWFDDDAATAYEETRYFDGSNHRSVHTHDQWTGRQLVRTARGAYVIRMWSAWQGARTLHYRVSLREAAEWFAVNGTEPPEDLRMYVDEMEV